MAKYTVTNTTILHNQKTYGVGSTILLTDDEQIAKLADYITPVEESNDASTDATATSTTKATKASKKSDKNTTSASDTNDTTTTEATSTETVASDETKQEDVNATTSV